MPGLYVIVKPTRLGVILESLDAAKSRIVINSNSRVSILKDISIYTNDADGSLPLEQVMTLIFDKHKDQIPVTSKSSDVELKSFLKNVMSNYDDSRVYGSDIKKLATWYTILIKNDPLIFIKKEESEIISDVENIASLPTSEPEIINPKPESAKTKEPKTKKSKD